MKYFYGYVQVVLQLGSYFSEVADAWLREENLRVEKRGAKIYYQNTEAVLHWDMSYGWRVQMSSAAANGMQNPVPQPDQHGLIFFRNLREAKTAHFLK